MGDRKKIVYMSVGLKVCLCVCVPVLYQLVYMCIEREKKKGEKKSSTCLYRNGL